MEKWRQIQQEPASSPDEMASQFTELVNDLGYAKTFYPRSKVTEYLNGLASRIYLSIYQNKKEKKSRILDFWKTELPLTIRACHRQLFFSCFIFLLFAFIAAFSASKDETFVRGVLGNAYVEMTDDNIDKGDPFGVYKGTDELTMFFYIALNNIRVSFMVFVSGVFAGTGTVYLLFSNGVMLGSFQYYFFAKGLGWPSVLVIWIHGTLEISAIIIAGAAGLVLAGTLLFPGTYTRAQSVMKGARDGLKIMIGLVPVFLVAAFFESFITRHSSMPTWLSIAILFLSFLFIAWYFIWYPIRLSQKMKHATKNLSAN